MQDDLLKKTKKRKMRTIAIIVILVLLAAVTVWGMSIKKANDNQKAKSETVQPENDKSDSAKADKSSDKKTTKNKSAEKSKKAASSSSSETKAAASTAKSNGKYVTISINCSELSNDMGKLTDQAVKNYIPSNGVILGSTRYKFSSGDTVYDALEAVCRSENILLDSEYDSTYNTRYIKGIGGLYEKDAGNNSGWLYYVNGVKPDYGCSQYKLKKGDVIKWKYTVNYAND